MIRFYKPFQTPNNPGVDYGLVFNDGSYWLVINHKDNQELNVVYSFNRKGIGYDYDYILDECRVSHLAQDISTLNCQLSNVYPINETIKLASNKYTFSPLIMEDDESIIFSFTTATFNYHLEIDKDLNVAYRIKTLNIPTKLKSGFYENYIDSPWI